MMIHMSIHTYRYQSLNANKKNDGTPTNQIRRAIEVKLTNKNNESNIQGENNV